MARYMDADEFRREMYHEAFETDSDLQKWDSGCWIRYKMFENAIENFPTVDAVPVVRCKDCKYYELDSWAKINGIPLIAAHHICKRWGEGCKTDENGFCFMGEKVTE